MNSDLSPLGGYNCNALPRLCLFEFGLHHSNDTLLTIKG